MRFSANLLLQKRGNQSGSQKMAAGKDKISNQKKKNKTKQNPQTKGEKGERGKQANQETRFTCRKQKLRERRTQPLMKQETKEARSDSNHGPVLVVPVSLLAQYRAIRLSTTL